MTKEQLKQMLAQADAALIPDSVEIKFKPLTGPLVILAPQLIDDQGQGEIVPTGHSISQADCLLILEQA